MTMGTSYQYDAIAVGEGTVAALAAAEYLHNLKQKKKQLILS